MDPRLPAVQTLPNSSDLATIHNGAFHNYYFVFSCPSDTTLDSLNK